MSCTASAKETTATTTGLLINGNETTGLLINGNETTVVIQLL
jgi:hypothetical protein